MAISTATAGKLSIVIGGDNSGFDKSAREAEKRVKALQKSVDDTVRSVARYATAAAFAGAAAATALVYTSQQAIDRQSKLSRQLGGTVEGVQALERVAQLAGISVEEMTSAGDRLNRKLGEAIRDGMSPAADALKRIGLNARELSKLDVDQRMGAIADAIKKAGLNAQQTADLLGQLGVRQGKLAALFEEGGQAFREARADVELFGVAVSKIDARNIERANDAASVFGLAMKGVGNQIAIQLAAPLELAAMSFREMVKEAGGIETVVAKNLRESAFWADRLVTAWSAYKILVGGVQITTQALMMEFEGAKKTQEEIVKLWERVKVGPNMESWERWLALMQDQRRLVGTFELFDKPTKPPPAGGDNLSSQQREQLEKRLQALRQSVATEDAVLALSRDKQIAEAQEFYAKGAADIDAYNELRLGAEDKYRQKLAELIFQKFDATFATEDELLKRKYEQQLAKLQEFENNKSMTVAEAEERRKKIQEKAEQDMEVLRARQWGAAAGIVDQALGNINALIGDQSKKAFHIMKAFATATAVIKGREAFVSAYAAGNATGIVGMGAIMAAASAIATGAAIAAMYATNPGSGSGGSTAAAGGGSAAAAAPAAPQQIQRTLVIEGLGGGKLLSSQQVRALIGQVNELAKDGGVTIVTK